MPHPGVPAPSVDTVPPPLGAETGVTVRVPLLNVKLKLAAASVPGSTVIA
jgi:hypothetical protein